MEKKNRKIAGIFLSVLLIVVFLSPSAYGELTATEKREKYYENVCLYAKEDGVNALSGISFSSCVIGPLGILFSAFIVPSVPSSRLIGRPAEYAEQYIKCYTEQARLTNMVYSGLFCGVWLVIAGGVVVLVFFGPK